MRFIYIPLPPDLPAQWLGVYARRIARVNALSTPVSRSDYINRNSSWGLLKEWLSKVSFGKCWYCETKSTRAPCDVDHFRPKLAVTVDGVRLAGHDGYYWLAYEWHNFRLSCQRCNRPEKDASAILRGKGSEFPIQDETQRCFLPASSPHAESPKILDPCTEDDCGLLVHCIDGEVKPAAQPDSWDYQRARYTIDLLGFNEWNTPEEKRGRWQTLATLITYAGNMANPVIEAQLVRYLSEDHEYSAFFRSAISTHRDKAWVEALL